MAATGEKTRETATRAGMGFVLPAATRDNRETDVLPSSITFQVSQAPALRATPC